MIPGKKTIFDYITEGTLDDDALARRMKDWIAASSPGVAERALKLYWNQSDEKRRALSDHGLTEKFVKKHETRLRKKKK